MTVGNWNHRNQNLREWGTIVLLSCPFGVHWSISLIFSGTKYNVRIRNLLQSSKPPFKRNEQKLLCCFPRGRKQDPVRQGEQSRATSRGQPSLRRDARRLTTGLLHHPHCLWRGWKIEISLFPFTCTLCSMNTELRLQTAFLRLSSSSSKNAMQPRKPQLITWQENPHGRIRRH